MLLQFTFALRTINFFYAKCCVKNIVRANGLGGLRRCLDGSGFILFYLEKQLL